ncbi:MAG TPA: heavy-metal-associated domain-containing protein [Anaerolineae bacterium]|nr:heavy-metal-associated domain-containing protein [Anaerolineae bacterium]HOR00002.1 heavy-metal-associated domain-containing protein [Anaerolineae bacterium]HPL27203.1 heavy-metal-associated domain-containing protein [Anaerolineae bacterium]
MAKEILNVPSISCMHCVRRITQALEEVPGVQSVQADAATRLVTVSYEGADTPARVRATLEEIGYPAVG